MVKLPVRQLPRKPIFSPIKPDFQIKLLLLQIAAIVHGFGTFTTLKEPKGITVTEDSVTDTSLFLTWDAVPKGPFTFGHFFLPK